MTIYKCKMCGGDLQIEKGATTCRCIYCDTLQTVPSADDEKKTILFNRANRLRMNSEFDKASGVYESIIADFPEEAEAYWGLVLCRYGIEYVDDPGIGRKIPTCHRSSFNSVMDDQNFELVMEYSDPSSRKVYREEAKQIEELRKRIIEISGKEEPYDIFICYKETDENGNRTVDSVLAQDIYDALTAKGYRVFFSRITLEDKLGQEYEPYIFAALHSAKVMLAVGTDYEYYNAAWVKNEWSRFLQLISAGEKKILIPCYKNIDAYDMPKEFARLQAQDLGKVGAMQDLLRGIDKLFSQNSIPNNRIKEPAAAVSNGGPNADALLKRGNMALEDKQWDKAIEFYDQVLSMNAECPEAYLGIFLANNCCSTTNAMHELFVRNDLRKDKNYQRAKQFSNEEVAKLIEEWEKPWLEQKQRAEQLKTECNSLKAQLGSKNYLDPEEKNLYSELKQKAEDVKKEYYANVKTKYLSMPEHNQMQELDNKISKMQHHLSSLGIFKINEKKQIKEEIEELNKEKKRIQSVLGKAEAEINQLKDSANIAEQQFREYCAKIEHKYEKSIKQKINKNELLWRFMDESFEVVKYGHYEQGKGIEPIEWIKLVQESGRILIISKYALDEKRYDTEPNETTWEKCTLRKWLNTEFINRAFTEEEQALISNIAINAEQNHERFTVFGNAKTDKVTLLTVQEANTIFKTPNERIAYATEYAKKQGAYTGDEGQCFWWLRITGSVSSYPANVENNGYVRWGNTDCYRITASVRPALWIDLNS